MMQMVEGTDVPRRTDVPAGDIVHALYMSPTIYQRRVPGELPGPRKMLCGKRCAVCGCTMHATRQEACRDCFRWAAALGAGEASRKKAAALWGSIVVWERYRSPR